MYKRQHPVISYRVREAVRRGARLIVADPREIDLTGIADYQDVYKRQEYPLAIKRLKIAISQAEKYGLLGRNILGYGIDFQIHIKEGAGAFVLSLIHI